jgi:hypothetical protein
VDFVLRHRAGLRITMLATAIVFALIAACGATAGAVPPNASTSEPPPDQPDVLPPEEPEEPAGQHFCCIEIDQKTATGDGCILISEQQVALCDTILYCDGKWSKVDGKVVCL